jgi:cyclophilin family peptidyl-prolyl cis-trans isomerase
MKGSLLLFLVFKNLLLAKTFVVRSVDPSRRSCITSTVQAVPPRIVPASIETTNKELASSEKRRSIVSKTLAAAVLAVTAWQGPQPSSLPARAVETAQAQPSFILPSEATITKKVFFNVRVSRQDGTFYVRDDLPDTPENQVFQGRIVVGLYGKNAPNHVHRFLSYIQTAATSLGGDDNDNPLPSYARSTFTRLDQATGLLVGGTIASLQLVDLNGSTALRYGSRVLPAPLWIERGETTTTKNTKNSATPPPRISHCARGLLTHAILDATPTFGITTRRDTTPLDATHTVFGTILWENNNEHDSFLSSEFLSLARDLPTYGVDGRPVVVTGGTAAAPDNNTLLDEAATAVFAAQRDFFRSTAKRLGDSRLDKVYEGKLLRRVEITQAGVLG